MFSLSIHSGMIARREVAGDLEHCEEMLPKCRSELRSAITNDVVGKTMVLKDFMHNNICGVFTSDLFSVGQEMYHLSRSINHC